MRICEKKRPWHESDREGKYFWESGSEWCQFWAIYNLKLNLTSSILNVANNRFFDKLFELLLAYYFRPGFTCRECHQVSYLLRWKFYFVYATNFCNVLGCYGAIKAYRFYKIIWLLRSCHFFLKVCEVAGEFGGGENKVFPLRFANCHQELKNHLTLIFKHKSFKTIRNLPCWQLRVLAHWLGRLVCPEVAKSCPILNVCKKRKLLAYYSPRIVSLIGSCF